MFCRVSIFNQLFPVGAQFEEFDCHPKLEFSVLGRVFQFTVVGLNKKYQRHISLYATLSRYTICKECLNVIIDRGWPALNNCHLLINPGCLNESSQETYCTNS